jgi:hypothetical protein
MTFCSVAVTLRLIKKMVQGRICRIPQPICRVNAMVSNRLCRQNWLNQFQSMQQGQEKEQRCLACSYLCPSLWSGASTAKDRPANSFPAGVKGVWFSVRKWWNEKSPKPKSLGFLSETKHQTISYNDIYICMKYPCSVHIFKVVVVDHWGSLSPGRIIIIGSTSLTAWWCA